MTEGPIRVVIAEDHQFFRDGLRTALEQEPLFRVVAEASDGVTALDQIRALKPAVAVLDIGLPRLNGVEVVRAMRDERLPVEVLFLTIHQHEEMFRAALDLGVKGYMAKDCTTSELRRCVQAIASGQYYMSAAMSTYLVDRTHRVEQFTRVHPGLPQLTSREREVLHRIAQGWSSKEIAAKMDVAAKTVDAHRANICGKLDLHGQHALTRFAAQHRDRL
jgi:DNA-binding NarL/FixJ family response regulator